MHRALAVTALVALAPGVARADEWWARDKALHFGASAGIAVGGYGVSSIWIERRWLRAVVGGGLALSAGVGKEAWDATGRGDPSWKDFTWDVAGSAVGVALGLAIDFLWHTFDPCTSRSSRR